VGIRSKAGLQKTATAWGNPAEKWVRLFYPEVSLISEILIGNAIPRQLWYWPTSAAAVLMSGKWLSTH